MQTLNALYNLELILSCKHVQLHLNSFMDCHTVAQEVTLLTLFGAGILLFVPQHEKC